MKYRSTRGTSEQAVDATSAIIQGLAPDGGLYVPVDFPKPSVQLNSLVGLSYQQIAAQVLSWFLDDYTTEQLDEIVTAAYGNQWDNDQIVSITAKTAGSYYMELFHGPTLAFKDLALQVLPQLMTRAVKIEDVSEDIVILTATSGDTGTASMRGFQDVTGTQVIVFYPHGGVSPVQLRQMLTQQGRNLQVVAVKGNFDQTQTNVKKIFGDREINERLAQNGHQFSSANSMNIGRLIPQVAYYFYTYTQLVQRHAVQLGDQVSFTVPTGNFGDILAGYYAKKIGLPIKKLVCASNQNNVLTDFFNTGKYDRNRPFFLTNSPSMDILVSSNLERLLFDAAGQDYQQVLDLMTQLTETGSYQITESMRQQLNDFEAGCATQDQINGEIKRVYEEACYAIDPHTAVASFVAHQYQQSTDDQTPMVVLSTASPYKFPETVLSAITDKPVEPGLAAVNQLNALLGDKLPAGVKSLFDLNERDEVVIEPDQMKQFIEKYLAN